MSNIGQQIIPGWLIINAELKNLLDGSVLRKGFQGETMLCYAIFDLYPTRFSLLMEDFALVVSGAAAVVLLNVLAAGLIMIVLSIILLPTYLLGVLRPAVQHPAIQKIALRLQKGVLNDYTSKILRHSLKSPPEIQGREV